ncbi:hypothetical protein AMECASPLE_028901 [Ameca splendens]|uniref:Uncharacterized protein n=1 Tax=Ameca splendens TaxID=208324 RepID=A0ABV0YSN8_9TELE
MPPNPNAINYLPQGHPPTDKLHPRTTNEDTSTQHKLHTQPSSKHPHRIPSPTTQRAATARQGPRTTPPQPPPTSATEQTPPSTRPTTDPPMPHQDGANTPGFFKELL